MTKEENFKVWEQQRNDASGKYGSCFVMLP